MIMEPLVKIHRPNGEEVSASALTERVIEHINDLSNEEPDAWLGLTLQEGSNACYSLAKESALVESALKLQPRLLDFFLLMYQIGALTTSAIYKNNLEILITPPIVETPDAPDNKETNIGNSQDPSPNINQQSN